MSKDTVSFLDSKKPSWLGFLIKVIKSLKLCFVSTNLIDSPYKSPNKKSRKDQKIKNTKNSAFLFALERS